MALAILLPGRAFAYERILSLDVDLGWGWAPTLDAPNHGPTGGVGTSIGFDDTWGLGLYGGWAVHPILTEADDQVFQIGLFGAEALYYFDILELVPFFGAGIDVVPSFDGTTWRADFAAHLRVSIDYLLSREFAIGVDVRPYLLITALPDLNPVYLTFQLRFSALLEY
ncbi:MAG: hypothetical protein AB7S26_41110 [Sandaracinaceae bacterium]